MTPKIKQSTSANHHLPIYLLAFRKGDLKCIGAMQNRLYRELPPLTLTLPDCGLLWGPCDGG